MIEIYSISKNGIVVSFFHIDFNRKFQFTDTRNSQLESQTKNMFVFSVKFLAVFVAIIRFARNITFNIVYCK